MCKNKLAYSLIFGALVLVGCSTKDVQSRNRLEYMRATAANPLELPPDLTKRNVEQNRSANVLSEYRKQNQTGTNLNVLAKSSDVKMEREGEQRWLVTTLPADFVWTKSMQLFQELGLTIEQSNPEAGIAETAWAENRADVPDSMLRRLLKGAMNQLFSSPTRDKFKFRMERGNNHSISIYITHYGMRDHASGNDDQFHTWIDRPRDPQLEAEFLSQLMVKLGGSQLNETNKTYGVSSAVQEGNSLTINRPHFSVWKQVGNILDDGAEYRIQEQNSGSNSYIVQRSKTVKRGFKFWKKTVNYDQFRVEVLQETKGSTRINVQPLGDSTYQQTLIDKLKSNLL